MAGRIVIERRDPIWRVRIDHAETRNALTRQMARELAAAFEEAENEPGARVVVLAGANGTFCSGHDLRELSAHPEDAWEPEANRVLVMPRSLGKPVVAAIEGAAYAGGFALALACDIRVAAEGARFCANGSQLGLLPIAGQLAWLPQVASATLAYEMLLTGEPVGADEAWRAGLISRVVPSAELESTALGIADRISRNAPSVLTAIKRGVRLGLGAGAWAAEAFEASEAYRHGSSQEAADRLAQTKAARATHTPAMRGRTDGTGRQ